MKIVFSSIITILIFTFFTLDASAQKKGKKEFSVPDFPKDAATELIVYTGVVEQEGTASELYAKTETWFNTFYKSPSSVIKNKTEGESIEGLGRFFVKYTNPNTGKQSNGGMVTYNIKVELKEGRYKYTISRIAKKQTSFYGLEKWIEDAKKDQDMNASDYFYQIDEFMKAMIEDLKNSVSAQPVKKEDW